MVNLVVRHPSNLQGTPLQGRGKATLTTRLPSPKPRDHTIPSPIRVPSYRNNTRPLSPLTTSESMFGTIHEVEQARSQSSDNSSRRGGGDGNRLDPISSRESMDSNGDYICDYDENVTQLYELLESSQWDKVRLRCRTYPEEVQTWIIRRDAGANTRWKLLPLHAAVIFQAPSAIIEGMLKEYPVAAGKRDDQGMLPLHLAFRHKQEETLLELLLQQYPQAVAVKDRRGRLPIDHGLETQFSASLLRKYADAHSMAQPSHAVDEAKEQFEAQLDTTKAHYEDQLTALARKHEQEMSDLKLKIEQDQHVVRTQHDQEMDELRDLLSREVATGQRTRQLQQEMEELQHSLTQTKSETQALKNAVRDHEGYEQELKEHLQQVLADQKSMKTLCTQQQAELEQAQQLRSQLLRSLTQKDDGNAVRTSVEICQLSDGIRHRTEQLLSRTPPTAAHEAPVVAKSEAPRKNFADHHHHHDTSGWENHGDNDHCDDISAITDDHF